MEAKVDSSFECDSASSCYKPVHVIVQYYTPKNKERERELDMTLLHIVENVEIDFVHLFVASNVALPIHLFESDRVIKRDEVKERGKFFFFVYQSLPLYLNVLLVFRSFSSYHPFISRN